MSDVVAVALITGGTTGVVGLAGLVLNFWNLWRERDQRLAERREDHREWYRRTLFERRLTAVQEASRWLAQVKDVMEPDPELTDDSGLVLLNTVAKARQWYDENFLYIHGGMPDECPVGAFLLASYWHARGYGGMPDTRLWQEASDLLKQEALELLQALAGGKESG